jgi:hypothetical protein
MTTTLTRTDAEIRAAVKAIFGKTNARVSRNGEIHVCGKLTNNKNGWYLLGFTGSGEIDNLIFYPDNTLNMGLAQ